MSWVYRLDPYEMQVAICVGNIRRSDSSGHSKSDLTLTNEQKDRNDIIAVRSEIAVSRMLNLCWTGMGKCQPDVGGWVEVRSIETPEKNLIIRATDKDDSPCVLVLVVDDVCTALCWAFARTAKRVGWKKGKNQFPYHLLLRGDCNQMDELPDIVKLAQYRV